MNIQTAPLEKNILAPNEDPESLYLDNRRSSV
jgi:hypothetical protein